MSRRILILGATGTLGTLVAQGLLDRNHTVLVLARSAKKARRLLGPEVEVFEGGSTNRVDLSTALVGCEAAHVSLPTELELKAVEHVVGLAEAGYAKDLRRISYISGTSVREENRWFEVVDVKMRAEDLLHRSGIPHTVFCPTWTMEVLPNFIRPDRAVMIMGKNPPDLHFFAAADFGRMVAESYGDGRALGRRLFIHGPESFTLPEALRAFHKACHPDVKLTRMRPWQAKLVATLTWNKSLGSVARLIEYFDKTQEHGDPSEANALLGAPETTLDQWIQGQSRRGSPN